MGPVALIVALCGWCQRPEQGFFGEAGEYHAAVEDCLVSILPSCNARGKLFVVAELQPELPCRCSERRVAQGTTQGVPTTRAVVRLGRVQP